MSSECSRNERLLSESSRSGMSETARNKLKRRKKRNKNDSPGKKS